MKHKFLLRFIKQEMEKRKIGFKNNEAFLKFFLPDAPWDSYRSNMSNWLSLGEKDGTIRKRVFIHAINEKLGLSSEIWHLSEPQQKKAVEEGVQRLKQALIEEETMFSWLESEKMSQQQEAFLVCVQNSAVSEIETALLKHKAWFEKRTKNQIFLQALFHQMYERGAYTFVYKHIFPALLDSYDTRVKSRKADIYASLPQPMYKEAFEILNSIKGENRSETIDLRTAAISNIRREKLSSKRVTREELKWLLHRLIKCYHKIYTPKQAYSYYPGINLAYMVAMVDSIFPDEAEMLIERYSITQIYSDVKGSLVRDRESDDKERRYYAGISDIEFQLLLGQPRALDALAFFLEELEPPISQINQTQRQMGVFFLDVIRRFSSHSTLKFQNMQHALIVLKSYIEAS